MGGLFSRRRRPERSNPNLAAVQAQARAQAAEAARQKAEQERRIAEEQCRAAEERQRIVEEEHRRLEEEQRRVEEEMRRAEQERQRAEELRRQAEEAQRRLQEETNKAHQQQKQADDARKQAEQNTARAAEERRRAEEQRKRAEEDRRKADEERARAEAEMRRTKEAKAQVEEEKRKADEQAAAARREQERAERERTEADNRAVEAQKALEEAERCLKEGIKPVIVPTPEEIAEMKKRLQYQEGFYHFAIAGVSGSGKSSLINAIRGLRNGDRGAALTGIVETTSKTTRYADTDKDAFCAWYDVPGAGTLKIPDWVYFNAQGLYVFDCVLVLIDVRFTDTDVAILRNCARFGIPAYIVRSKSNQHIRNIMEDMGYESDDDEEMSPAAKKTLYKDARDKYIRETRANVADNLEGAKLPPQRVYLVTKDSLVKIVNGKPAKDALDENDLLHDLVTEAQRRRSGSI